MKEQAANDLEVGETSTAKQPINGVAMDVTVATKIPTTPTTTVPTKLLIEGDTTSNNIGGPKAAVALLSLGQDLANGDEAADGAVAAVRVPPLANIRHSMEEQKQQRDHLENPLELVATSDIPMLPIDIGTKVDRTVTMVDRNAVPATMNPKEEANQKKRKHPNSRADNNEKGNPPDFWHWLPVGENVGNWDVLCGRGGESNNYIGNKRYRKVIGERKPEYRKIDVKQRKRKTDFVREIVQHIKNQGGRFIDVIEGKYYVVTDGKARKKTSQALRETKELKWLVDSYEDDEKECRKTKKVIRNKDVVCPFCKKKGHKTRIAKACLRHHEWLDINNASTKTAVDGTTNNSSINNTNNIVVS